MIQTEEEETKRKGAHTRSCEVNNGNPQRLRMK